MAIDDAKLEQLTREMGWIRGLARALVHRDADDLAQDAWLVAARDAPVDRPLRPWLVRMTTNLARMRGRSASRRDAREQHAEPARTVPTPQQLVERVELGRLVAEEVVALGEPYRSTILLHFFEGLSSAEIARRLDLPDGTIRRRLKVGLDQLRERLRERSEPPIGGWLAALIPLAGPPPPPAIRPIAKAAAATTSSSAGTVLVVAAIALVIAGGVVWQLVQGDRDELAPTAPPIARVYAAAPVRDAKAPPVAEGSLVYGQPGAPARRLRGIVTADGAPAANAIVHLGIELVAALPLQSWEPPRPTFGKLAAVAHVTTDAQGHFDFGERPAGRYVITAQASDRASVSTTVEAANPTIRVDAIELALGACVATLDGRVHDAQGTGLVAHVESSDLSAVDTTAHGDFALCVTPDPTLSVTSDGYATTSRKLAGTGELHADISLVPGSSASGRVVDELDHPVHSARVTAVPVAFATVDNAAERSVASDGDGHFELDQLAAGRWYIRAVAADAGAAAEAVVTIEPGAVVADVRLVVTPRVRVRGRVTLDGAPVVGAEIEGSFHAYSQRDGSFEVTGIVPGRINLHVVGFVLPENDFIVDGTREIELRVMRHAYITGRVTSNGAACTDVTISCPDNHGTTTDASGAYTCVAPTFGRDEPPVARVGARSDCKVKDDRLRRASVERAVSSNTATTIDLELGACNCTPEPAVPPSPPSPTRCRGAVVAASGGGLPHALVWMPDATTTADDTGAFWLDGCGPSYPGQKPLATVFASRDAQAPLPVVSFTGDGTTTPYAITVDTEPMMVRGRVFDQDRKPVVDARVALVGKIGLRGSSGDDRYAATTLADGRFSIGPVAKFAHYTLTAAVGNLRGEVTDVAGDTDITVGGNGSIHGDLQGDWDSPTVLVRSLAGPPAERTASVDDYELDLRDVSPGLYEVIAYDSLVERRGTAIVQSGKIAHVSLFGHGTQGESRARVVDVKTHAGIPGMACQQGSHISVVLADGDGRIVSSQGGALSCWSSRGPAVPVVIEPAPVDCGECVNDDHETLVQLVRPGSVQPGFVVAPRSSPPVVAVVDPGGPAQVAGLEPDDAIIELDGAGVAHLSPQDLMYLVWSHPHGSMRLGVRRGSSVRTIVVTLP